MTSETPIGILLTNLGTPDTPDTKGLRRYLAEFLWDPRVVEAPRLPWWLVLHGVILRTRPRKSAQAYQRIWEEDGSPLLTTTRRQAEAVRRFIAERTGRPIPVAVGMRYGRPSIEDGIAELERAGAERIAVLPLYPQYSASTTASTYDAVAKAMTRRRRVPGLRLVRDYHDHPGYLDALAASISEYWQHYDRGDILLFSFHGIPREYADRGDPYPEQCARTAAAVAGRLGLGPEEWLTTFQSRFGPKEWLQPYTDVTLQRLAGEGTRRVDMICPGFAADCLETLEENDIGNRELFIESGGESFHYIPCLNVRDDHIRALGDIVLRELQGWLAAPEPAANDDVFSAGGH
ncbi:ferrochelatase [Arhodomonas sp. KWT2]|uniref:ferrochelatase n=1 Tax=unclassified Arhodomonas TaxID=2621637 RepID=UPI0013D4D53B|nr:ferrochelatase [Arhodomonas sp. KWT]